MRIGVITNPNSRKNKRRVDRRAELAAIVGVRGVVEQTPTTNDIKPILRDFLRRDVTYWVADGGDGTFHWLLNEGHAVLREREFASRQGRLPTTVPTNGGTIDFIAKKAGVVGDGPSILRSLTDHVARGEAPDEVAVDTLAIRMLREEPDGSERWLTRVGFASAAGGAGQRFFSYYYASKDPTNLTIARIFGLGLLSIPFEYTPLGRLPGVPDRWAAYCRHLFRPTRARVSIDGETLPWQEHRGIHASSIDINLGDAVRLFARAAVPGKLQFTVAHATVAEIVANLPAMILGRHVKAKTLWDGVGQHMAVEALGDELLDPIIDGEVYRRIRRIEFGLGPTVRLARVGQRGAAISKMMHLGWVRRRP